MEVDAFLQKAFYDMLDEAIRRATCEMQKRDDRDAFKDSLYKLKAIKTLAYGFLWAHKEHHTKLKSIEENRNASQNCDNTQSKPKKKKKSKKSKKNQDPREKEYSPIFSSLWEDLAHIKKENGKLKEHLQQALDALDTVKSQESIINEQEKQISKLKFDVDFERITNLTFRAKENNNNASLTTEIEGLQKELEIFKCCVCLDTVRTHMFKGCNHFCCCKDCAEQCKECPICKKKSPVTRIYIS